MITKAIIQSIDYSKNICRVRIPLFETASRNVNMIEADAQFSIVPGIYNSYNVGDVVFIGFEENKMEGPIILGKLFVSASVEASSYRGNLSGNSLSITESAQLPYSTVFNYSKITQNENLYKDLNTPKKLADSILKLQSEQSQKYQTVIKVLASKITRDEQSTKTTYYLYLKTSSDFTYLPDSSDSLLRLFAVLSNSQTSSIFIPLELAMTEDGTIYSALLQVLNSSDNVIQLKLSINGELYLVEDADILEIQSQAIYY